MFQPVPDVAKVAVVMLYDLQNVVNVFHFRRVGQWGLPELESLAQVVATTWVNDVMIHLSANSLFLRVESRGLRAQNDVSFDYVLANPVAGSRPGDSLPGSVAFAVTHLTGLTGRSNRGRTFFGALAESDVSGSTIAPARANGLRDGLASVRNLAANAGWQQVVVSRYENKVRRPEGIAVPVIGFRYRDLTVDSQRRRLPGRGS